MTLAERVAERLRAINDDREIAPYTVGQMVAYNPTLFPALARLVEVVGSHGMFEDDECDCGFRASSPSLDEEHNCPEMEWYRNANAALRDLAVTLGVDSPDEGR